MSAAERPPSARLSRSQVMDLIEGAHTGIVASLRQDGSPVMTPVWFVVHEGAVCFRTRMGSRKIRRLREQPRCSFLAEAGTSWRELRAGHLQGSAHVLNAGEGPSTRIEALLNQKYADFRTAPELMPAATRAVYERPSAYVVITVEHAIGWNNAALLAAPTARPMGEASQTTDAAMQPLDPELRSE